MAGKRRAKRKPSEPTPDSEPPEATADASGAAPAGAPLDVADLLPIAVCFGLPPPQTDPECPSDDEDVEQWVQGEADGLPEVAEGEHTERVAEVR